VTTASGAPSAPARAARPRTHPGGRQANTSHVLPRIERVLAVCAHPDDESFGLGAVLAALAKAGGRIGVLCFSHGEASTLHGVAGDLATIRAQELRAAAQVLGVSRVELLDYPDGALAAQPPEELTGHVLRAVTDVQADGLLVFDHGGVTGHPDHQAATDATLAAAATLDRTVLAWALPRAIADALNHELGTAFVGRDPDEVDFVLDVDRGIQLEAISCHASQATDNPVVRRRLELQADHEWLRVLRQRIP
jgi:LmbE family N-acetylglucosaminyl deacetylase